MKKLFLTLVIASPAALLAQDAPFTVNGKVGKLNAPAKAYLVYRAGGKQVIDSSEIKNGVFGFKGNISGPVQANIMIDHKGTGLKRGLDAVTLFVDKGTVEASSTTDSIKHATLKGSINQQYTAYKKSIEPMEKATEQINSEWMAAPDEKKKDPSFREGLMARNKPIAEQKTNVQKKFIADHPDSYLSLVLLREVAGSSMDITVVEPLFNKLSAAVKGTQAGKDMATQINAARATAMGAIAPEFTQNDVNDKPVKLSDFRGKYVLVDFWASWCGPCRAENPNVVKAYNAFKDKNFTVLGVSLDNPGKKDAWLAAIEKDGLTWTQLSDLKGWDNEVAKQYGIRGIPANLLLDKNGKIIGKNLRGEDLEKRLAEVLN